MKKLTTQMAIVLLAATASVAYAQGGFQGPNAATQVTTVAQASAARDDTHVVLKGYIIERVRGEDYVFKDSTGTIRVEIDHDKWAGQSVTPETMVEIYGEVDKDWNSVEVDVKSIRIVQ